MRVADSPTIKYYTRWELFEEAKKKKGKVEVLGAEKQGEVFSVEGKRVEIRTVEGTGHAHVEGNVKERLFIVEDSTRGPLFVTGRIQGKGEVFHLIRGGNIHYSHWEVKGNLVVRTLLVGREIYLRYDGEGRLRLYGVSLPGRSDVNHHLTAGDIENVHLLVPDDSSFLVHRPLVKLGKGGSAHVETRFLPGGLVVAVPSVEVYTSEVETASHSVKDLSFTGDQLFYLRSRGLTPHEARSLLIEETMKFLLGGLYEEARTILQTVPSLRPTRNPP